MPLAVVQPRLSVVWLLPLLTWGITSAGCGVGHVETSLRVLAVFAVVSRPGGPRGAGHGASRRLAAACDGAAT